jgi:thiamine-phosphate pyrophosphorylase
MHQMTSHSVDKLWRYAEQLHAANQGPQGLPPLLFLTDHNRIPDPAQVIGRLPPGSGVILRDYDTPNRQALAQSLAQHCKQAGVMFLVGLDEQLAMAVGADGLHLPEHAIAKARQIRQRHPHWWLTAATHSVPAARKAEAAGADAVLMSPVFPTQSHPGAATLGALQFASMVRQVALPAYALGGVTAENAHLLRGSGTIGIATIGGVALDTA